MWEAGAFGSPATGLFGVPFADWAVRESLRAPFSSVAAPAPQGPGGEREGAQAAKLFVGNLSWSVTSEELLEYLRSNAGGVTACQVCRNHNGQSKGFGLATFDSASAAARAIAACHDVEMGGRRLVVRPDVAPEARPTASKAPAGAPGFLAVSPETTANEGTRRHYQGS